MALKYPGKPEVGVGALVISGDTILLVKRANPPGAGKWSLPGGHLRLGETIYEAALRELEEETGIYGAPMGTIGVGELIERDERGIEYHYVLIDILVEPYGGLDSARPSSDALDVAIVKLGEALDLELTNTTRRLLERLTKCGIQTLPLESSITVDGQS